MKRNYIFILVLLLLTNKLTSQTFQRTYGSKLDDIGSQIIQTQDDNYAIVGTYESRNGIYLFKVDFLGNSIWQKTYTSKARYSYFSNYSFQETQDNGFLIAGTYSHNNDYKICLIKTDSIGDILWTKFFKGPKQGIYLDGAYDIINTSDNGYAIIGTTKNVSETDVFLMKIDSKGNVQWSKYYGGKNDDVGVSIKQTSDNGFVIAGYTDSFGMGIRDVYLLKVNSTGDLLWTKTYGGNSSDYANHVELTSDGGFILTGVTSGYGTGKVYDNDLFLMKTDSSGNSIWAYTYGGDSDETGYSVKQTSDKGYIATGYIGSSLEKQEDASLLKIDSVGNILWSKRYGGSSTDRGYDVIQQKDNYLIVGETRNFGKGLSDVYFIKADSLGNSSCKQDTAITIKTVLPWAQGKGGVENNGHTIISDTITYGNPDTTSNNPCFCVPPIASFKVSMTHIVGTFSSYSTWADTWYWDFGDGDTSTAENPIHLFSGTFKVCLTVKNDCGTDTFCDTIHGSVGMDEIPSNKINMLISPNPLNDFTVIKFDNSKSERLKLILFNAMGQKVLQIDNITNNKIKIKRNKLLNGLYFIQLIKNNQVIGVDKIIVSE